MKSLNLSQNSRLTDDALKSISHMSGLQSLNLMHSKITNDGIPHLKSEFAFLLLCADSSYPKKHFS